MARAQLSTEMLAVLSAVLLVFVFSLFLVSGQIATVADTKDRMDAFLLASTLGSAINGVYLAGDGASTTVNLWSKNASVWIYDRQLNVRSGSAFYDWPLLTNSTGALNVSTGDVRISNINWVVLVESA